MTTALARFITVGAIAALGAQTPPRDQPGLASVGSAVISGTVIMDDETRAPLKRATVTLERTGIEDIRTTTTDDEGRFAFHALPSGSYRLSASKGAYVSISYGAPKPGMPGRAIVLTDAQNFAAKPIALMRGAVIAGRLLDRQGRSIAGTPVTASRFMFVNGERRRRTTEGSERSAMTNAHGDYRIYGLLPGDYLIYAGAPSGTETDVTAAELRWASNPTGPAPGAGRPFSYAPTIFPGTADAAAATPITVARGEERLGVDFALQYVPVLRLTGVVTGADGKPAPNITIRQEPKRPSAFATDTLTRARSGPDGGFVFGGVVPGEYRLIAQGGQVTTPVSETASRVNYTQWGIVDVRLSGQDVSDVVIRLEPGSSVTGRLVLSGAANTPPPDFSRVLVQLGSAAWVGGGSSSFTANPDGTFRIEGVPPGESRLTLSVPGSQGAASPWFVRSAVYDGRDLLDVPLDVAPGVNISNVVVTLSDSPTQVSGALLDASDRPATEFYVFMFPTDKSFWTSGSRRINFARPADNGTYTINGLAPGEYYLCALTELDLMLRFEPSYLEEFIPAAIKITLGDGEKKTQSLRIGG